MQVKHKLMCCDNILLEEPIVKTKKLKILLTF